MTTDQILAKCKELCPEQDFKLCHTPKGDAIILEGVRVSPTIYLNLVQDPETIVKLMKEYSAGCEAMYEPVVDLCSDRQSLLTNAFISVRPAREGTMHVLDLSVEYRVLLSAEPMIITSAVLNKLPDSVTDKEFLEAGKRNQKSVVKSLLDVVGEKLGTTLRADEVPLYLVTNEQACNGAALMLNDKVMSEVAAMLSGDLIILPSSIHEILVMVYHGDDLTELSKMVKEINMTQVAPEERLADHVYVYRREEHTLECDGYEPYNLIA